MSQTTHFFLGSNSSEGFFSLYDQLMGGALDELTILKGGPGCGKSTLMRKLAERAEEQNLDTVLIHCSGDPESLDGVLIPSLKKGCVDGTSPHVLEPRYMSVRERYLDFSDAYDHAKLREKRDAIIAATDACKASYCAAYRVLQAMNGVENMCSKIAREAVEPQELNDIALQLIHRSTEPCNDAQGRAVRVFLGGMTHLGRVCRFDTVAALCPRVYALEDSYGIAAPIFETLGKSFQRSGEDIIFCMDPDRPCQVQHLLIPKRGLAFVTVRDDQRLAQRALQRIRLNQRVKANVSKESRAALRLSKSMLAALSQDAKDALGHAKKEHDFLEKLYHPCINFNFIDDLTEKNCRQYFLC